MIINRLKVKIFLLILFIKYSGHLSLDDKENFNRKYSSILKTLDYNSIKKKLRIAIYTLTISGGGRARMTALLINYLHKIKIFKLYLFSKSYQQKNEFIIPNDTTRVLVKNNLVKNIEKYKIDIFIHQRFDIKEIKLLNLLQNTKVIFYLHSSIFTWIYSSINYFKKLYNEFKKSKYVINIIPYENDYLFKRWGIRSFYLDNFVTYDYDSIVPSDLSEKIILMVGRANRKNKRFNLGIEDMKFIIKEVPDSQLNIISKSKPKKLKELIYSLNLKENVKFAPFTLSPSLYFKNASLHIFPTNYESFGLVLCETKIYGIPNILLGLNYVSIAKGGTIIIYDDKPESFANEAIKILKNKSYRKKLGKEARKSMKKFNNDILLLKWVQLILSVYKGDKYFELLRNNREKISDDEAINIINSQVKFLQMRLPNLRNITFNKFINLI
jgi:glycosyltransferase involved in cell wall biosynthesis